MDTSEIAVMAGGAALIGGVLWFFFGPRRKVRVEAGESGVQEVEIRVKGGYSPDVVVVKAGRPVRLKFYRDETSSCSEEVVVPAFGISKRLPAHQTTSVEFTPREAGAFPFTCGMSMMRGKIVVEE
jgi:plastocyanin domain-containing protein